MPVDVLMPALSPTMEKGNLAKWVKSEGDKVKAGDVIAEIETDKATMEVEAVDEGTLGKILVPEGTNDVAVNTPIAMILSEGEDAASLNSAKPSARKPQSEPATTEEVEESRPRDSSTSSVVAGSLCGFRADGLAEFSDAASSPSERIIAIGVLTATSLVPSGTRILPSVPSSTASTSMVALSVSISAMTSPDLTLSPPFFSHLAILPFSMVGDSAGINTGRGMGATARLDCAACDYA